ncbi:MAG: biotin/lipoyl-containing protein [Candidatus Acidiferrales bacterium]
MKLNLKIGGRNRIVEIERRDGRTCFILDGHEVSADLVEVQPGIYSVLIGGQAFEASVAADSGSSRVKISGREFPFEIADPRRWSRGRRGVAGAEGEQSVAAPMPGKVVRVLVKIGDAVEIGQGLIVVEAMKMQNEIKSPKAGKIDRLAAREGQAVNAGDILAVIA